MNEYLQPYLPELFHFLRPEYLKALILVGIVGIIGLIGIKEQVKWKKSIASHLQPYMIDKGSEWKKVVNQLLLYISISIAIIGISGPTWQRIETPGKILETPVVILLDLSQSMMADDLPPSRLERAKFKINELLDLDPKARIALVGYSGTAHTIIPLCYDYKVTKSHLEGATPFIMPYPGTNLPAAINKAQEICSITKAPGNIIIFTDEINFQDVQLLTKYVDQQKDKITIVPVATPIGSPIPIGNSKRRFFDNKEGQVISKLDIQNLSQLKKVEKITVASLTLDNSDMQLVAKQITDNIEFQDSNEEHENEWIDNGYYLIIPLLIYILLWFRRGVALFSIIGLLMIVNTRCKQIDSSQDLWYTKDYQAQKAFDNKAYEKAAELYTTPYNKGVAYYKAGKYEEAIYAFQQDSSAKALYNLGLSYYHTGDYIAASFAFNGAYEKDSTMINAISNKQLLQSTSGTNDSTYNARAEQFDKTPSQQNMLNKDMEDLGGGGQEANDEQMNDGRKEETVATDMRIGEELSEIPENFDQQNARNKGPKVLMRKVDDNPALFLKKKFNYQVKKKNQKPPENLTKW